MKITHNQTNPEWLVGLDLDSFGTGVFLVPDVQRNEGIPLKVEVRSYLTYPECVRRAEFVAAFKWIPEKIWGSGSDPESIVKSVKCRNDLCTDYCAETLCWCVGGVCRSMT